MAVNKEIYNVLPLEITREEGRGYNLLKVESSGEIHHLKVKGIELLKVL